MKLKWCDRTLVVGTHFFTLCTNEKLYKSALKHLNIPKTEQPPFVLNWHSNGTIHFFDNQKDQTKTAVVCLHGFEGKSITEIHGLLVHEAMHLWREIRETLGESNPSFEFEAYSVQNIAQQLFAEFERQTK